MGFGDSRTACKQNYIKDGDVCRRDCSKLGLERCGPLACAIDTADCVGGIMEKIIDIGAGVAQLILFIGTLGASSAVSTLFRTATSKIKQKIGAVADAIVNLAARIRNYFKNMTREDWRNAVKVDASKLFSWVTCNTITEFFYDKVNTNQNRPVDQPMLIDIFDKLTKFRPAYAECKEVNDSSTLNNCFRTIIGDISWLDPTGLATIVYGAVPNYCNFQSVDNPSRTRRSVEVTTTNPTPELAGKVVTNADEDHSIIPHTWVKITTIGGDKCITFVDMMVVKLLDCSETNDSQLWIFDPHQSTYRIRSINHLVLRFQRFYHLTVGKVNAENDKFSIIHVKAGYVKFKEIESVKCIQASDNSPLMLEADCEDGNMHQHFQLIEVGGNFILPTKYIQLKNSQNNNCLWVQSSSEEIAQNECNFYNNKNAWYLLSVENEEGLFYIVSGTNVYLKSNKDDSNPTLMSSIFLANDDTYKWYFKPMTTGKWLISNFKSGKVISTTNTQTLTLVDTFNHTNVQFTFELMDVVLYGGPFRFIGKQSGHPLGSSNNQIVLNNDFGTKNKSWNIDVNLRIHTFKLKVMTGQYLGNNETEFKLVFVKNQEYYMIRRNSDSKCVEATGTNPVTFENCNESNNSMQFSIFYVPEKEPIRIIHVNTQRCLEENGKILLQNECSLTNPSQLFVFNIMRDDDYIVFGNRFRYSSQSNSALGVTLVNNRLKLFKDLGLHDQKWSIETLNNGKNFRMRHVNTKCLEVSLNSNRPNLETCSDDRKENQTFQFFP